MVLLHTGFVKNVCREDVCAVGDIIPDWTRYGGGVTNSLPAPDLPLDTGGEVFRLPSAFRQNDGLKSLIKAGAACEPPPPSEPG